MNPYLKNYVVSFELGRGKRHENMAVFPITTQSDGGPDYLTLKEASRSAFSRSPRSARAARCRT